MAEDSGVQVQAITASAKAEVPAPGVAVWNWFSLDQAASAALFSRKCGELEDNPPTPSAEDLARGMAWSEACAVPKLTHWPELVFSAVRLLSGTR